MTTGYLGGLDLTGGSFESELLLDEFAAGNYDANENIFAAISRDNYLRPFELATRRLLNMIEIINNWNVYAAKSAFLTQRGATFLIDNDDKLLYKFISNNLLGYSDTMNLPLSYLDNFLIWIYLKCGQINVWFVEVPI